MKAYTFSRPIRGGLWSELGKARPELETEADPLPAHGRGSHLQENQAFCRGIPDWVGI